MNRIFRRRDCQPTVDVASIAQAVEVERRLRREKVFPGLREGFTFQSSGRAGTIYFVEERKMMEIDCEMSGSPDLDILIWPEGAGAWVYPKEESVSEEKRTQVIDALRIWLHQQGWRSDLDREKDQNII